MRRAIPPLLALACAGAPPLAVDLSDASRRYRADDFARVRARWTRHDTARKDFDLAIDVDGTFLSWDMRQALVARQAAWATLPPDQVQAQLARQRDELDTWWEIVLQVRTSREAWNDLQAQRSIWRCALIDDRGRQADPIKVLRVQVPTAADQELFPPPDEFTKMYRARFPRAFTDGTPVLGPGTRWFVLRIAGALGRADLRWETLPRAMPLRAAGEQASDSGP